MTEVLSPWQLAYQFSGLLILIVLVPPYLFALVIGGSADRPVAHVLALGALLDTLFATSAHHAIGDQLGIDSLLLAGLTVLALRSARHYTLVLAAAQLLIVITDALRSAGLIGSQLVPFWLVSGLALLQLGVFAAVLALGPSARPARKIRVKYRARSLAPRGEHAR